MPRPVRAAVAVFVFVAFTTPLVAQTAALSADEKELAAYRLTVPTLNKVAAAMRSMAQEMMQDPKVKEGMKLEAEIDALEQKEELTEAEQEKLEKLRERQTALEESMPSPMGNNAQTLSDMEAAITQFPQMARALQREGLTPREYATFMLAMLQAGLAYGLSQGKLDMSKLPAGINPENIKFIAEHQKELEAMQKEFEVLSKKK
jgi:uncharacterized protein DUF4145